MGSQHIYLKPKAVSFLTYIHRFFFLYKQLILFYIRCRKRTHHTKKKFIWIIITDKALRLFCFYLIRVFIYLCWLTASIRQSPVSATDTHEILFFSPPNIASNKQENKLYKVAFWFIIFDTRYVSVIDPRHFTTETVTNMCTYYKTNKIKTQRCFEGNVQVCLPGWRCGINHPDVFKCQVLSQNITNPAEQTWPCVS